MKISLLLFPLFILTMILNRPGPVTVFRKAGAVSPETARRPSSLKIDNLDLVKDAARKGRLIATGDGRYYVDMPGLKRRQRWIFTALAVVAAAVIIEGFILIQPMIA
jgi:hypothetical protein